MTTLVRVTSWSIGVGEAAGDDVGEAHPGGVAVRRRRQLVARRSSRCAAPAGRARRAIITRPMTLVSMPTPLMSLPIRSISSTSRSSTGRRGGVRRGEREQRRLAVGDRRRPARPAPPSSGRARSRRCPRRARRCVLASTCSGDARHQLAQAAGAVGVQRLGLHPLAEPDRRHLHQPALVRAVEVGVLLDPVDDDRRRRRGGVGVGDDRHRQVVLAGDRHDVHRRAHRAAHPSRRRSRTRRAPRAGPRRWRRRGCPSPARGTATAPWARTHATTRADHGRSGRRCRATRWRSPPRRRPASATPHSASVAVGRARRRRRAAARRAGCAPGGTGRRRSWRVAPRASRRSRGRGCSESVKATPCQAMSNAVPWSTDVRMIGRPSVTLTPVSNASSFIGPCPWSWYMHTIAS